MPTLLAEPGFDETVDAWRRRPIDDPAYPAGPLFSSRFAEYEITMTGDPGNPSKFETELTCDWSLHCNICCPL